MTSEVRLWRISETASLRELPQVRLGLEERLEQWLVADISVLDPNLLIIGRQVETDFGGLIDLLCLDEVGDVVVVELKRDKTPREVTAQVLDYGSWVVALSNERITAIAEANLGGGSLEEAFAERFATPLPETLGQNHRLLVVGSMIDQSSERIIEYLSGSHGVNINAATFQYFKDESGRELLARVFVVEPSQVEQRTRTRGSSKRRPRLTFEELDSIADEKGVSDLYRLALAGLEAHLHKGTTRSSVALDAVFDGRRKVVVSLIPPESNHANGLRFRVYSARLAILLGIPEADLPTLLPAGHTTWETSEPEYAGHSGFFATDADIDRFVSAFSGLRAAPMISGVPSLAPPG